MKKSLFCELLCESVSLQKPPKNRKDLRQYAEPQKKTPPCACPEATIRKRRNQQRVDPTWAWIIHR